MSTHLARSRMFAFLQLLFRFSVIFAIIVLLTDLVFKLLEGEIPFPRVHAIAWEALQFFLRMCRAALIGEAIVVCVIVLFGIFFFSEWERALLLTSSGSF